MNVLILGANSYLGSRLFFDLRNTLNVTGTYHSYWLSKDFIHLDVTDRKQVSEVILKVKPDYILHTANFPSSRPYAEDKAAYTRLNVISAEYIRDAANTQKSKVIFISSNAAIAPADIYGELKRKSEDIIKGVKAGYVILRPSLILGMSPNTRNDRPFNRVLRHIHGNTVAEFDTSWKFQPTYIGHISGVTESCISKNILNTTIHIFCPSVQTQDSTARDILMPFGIRVKPIDKHMNTKACVLDEKELTDAGLPTCSYETMIRSIHKEIRNRDTYRL